MRDNMERYGRKLLAVQLQMQDDAEPVTNPANNNEVIGYIEHADEHRNESHC